MTENLYRSVLTFYFPVTKYIMGQYSSSLYSASVAISSTSSLLGGGIQIPWIYQIYGFKKEAKYKGQPSQTLFYDSELYILFINIHILFFCWKGLYLGGFVSKEAYNRRDLYISSLVGLHHFQVQYYCFVAG